MSDVLEARVTALEEALRKATQRVDDLETEKGGLQQQLTAEQAGKGDIAARDARILAHLDAVQPLVDRWTSQQQQAGNPQPPAGQNNPPAPGPAPQGGQNQPPRVGHNPAHRVSGGGAPTPTPTT